MISPALSRATGLVVLLAAGACSFIPDRPGADRVAVGDEKQFAGCERKGATTVSVLHRAGFVERTDEAVATDLARLAANDAVDMGGNAVAPLGPIADGKRKFAIYRCAAVGGQ